MQHRSSFTRRQFAGSSLAGSLALSAGFGSTSPVRAQEATPLPGDLAAQFEAVAPKSAYLASELVDGSIQPIDGLNPDEVQGVGSSFKLYILATLGQQVRDGLISWDDPIEIREENKSVPGGDLRYVENGTVFTLRYIAERMIQKSDNTATDHALMYAGREAVEEMFVTAGHASPELNVPLLRTREFAFLKFLYPDLDGYLAADTARRREILETEIAALDYEDLLAVAEEQEAPLHIDTVEWFASSTDLTNVMLTLKTMAESDFALQPLLEIMSLETQLVLDGEVWPYAGFKGGSEMGVLRGTWLLRRHDSRWFVFTAGFNDTEAEIDMVAAVTAMAAGIDALAKAP